MITCEHTKEAFMYARVPLGTILIVADDGIGKSVPAKA